MARSTDASIAFSVTDNLSESVVKMKNAITSTKQDAEQLQKTLDRDKYQDAAEKCGPEEHAGRAGADQKGV